MDHGKRVHQIVNKLNLDGFEVSKIEFCSRQGRRLIPFHTFNDGPYSASYIETKVLSHHHDGILLTTDTREDKNGMLWERRQLTILYEKTRPISIKDAELSRRNHSHCNHCGQTDNCLCY